MAGVILPAAADLHLLFTRDELCRHLISELKEQQAGSGLPTHLWFGTTDGLLAGGDATLGPANPFSGASLQLIDPSPGDRSLDAWLHLSQVVLLVDLVDQHGQGLTTIGQCRQQRLDPRQVLPENSTICFNSPLQGDGLVGEPLRYAGSDRLEAEQEHRPVWVLERYVKRWRHFGQGSQLGLHAFALGEQAWRTSLAVDWALQESAQCLRRSDRRLVLRSAALALALVLLHLHLQRLSSSFLPSLLLLAGAAVLLGIQPQRQQAQQWWCLAQELWLQDTWYRFGLKEALALRLPHQRRRDDGAGRGELLHLLQSHQLALALDGAPQPWCRRELGDGIAGLERHLELIQQAIRQRRAVARLMLLPALLCVGLALIALLQADTQLLELVVLVAGVALSALWLARPLPLGRLERLERHRRSLEAEIPRLKRLLQGSELSDPNLRGEIAGSFHRIGEQLLDLNNDAMEASAWNWAVQP